jgi:predicted DNA-binding protein
MSWEASLKKLLIYLDEERHEDLKMLARHHKTSMAELVRSAIEDVFEDDLDAMRGQRRLEEAARDPNSTMSWEEFKAELGGHVRASA